jgi:hypothetical protein
MVQLLTCLHTVLAPAPMQQEHTALGILGSSCCSLVPLRGARAPVLHHTTTQHGVHLAAPAGGRVWPRVAPT